MKKNKLTIGALLLAMNCFGQSDTLTHAVSGKTQFEFKTGTSKIINVIDSKKYEDFTFKLNKNCFLYIDLFDKVNGDTLYLRNRLVTVYIRNGEIDTFFVNSEDITLQFTGNWVEKVVIHAPKLK
tara:strand:+ start:453 stop:827 length:375 start_codon:yes stop_codon:yes gene_type:complete